MIHENIFKNIEFGGVKGFVFIGEKILVYRRDNNTKNFPLHIDLPGGGRENNESPFETFKREVSEEFGINIKEGDISFCDIVQNIINPDKVSYLFITQPLEYTEKDIIFGNEGVEWMLLTIKEFIEREDGINKQQDWARKYFDK